jgi:hypothetical protein
MLGLYNNTGQEQPEQNNSGKREFHIVSTRTFGWVCIDKQTNDILRIEESKEKLVIFYKYYCKVNNIKLVIYDENFCVESELS